MVWSFLLIASGCLAAWSFLQATPTWLAWRRVGSMLGFFVPVLTAIVVVRSSPGLAGVAATRVLVSAIGLGIALAITASSLVKPRVEPRLRRFSARRTRADRLLPVVFSLATLGASWLGVVEPLPLAELQGTVSFAIVALLVCGVMGSPAPARLESASAEL